MSHNASVLKVAMPKRVAALPVSEKGYPVPWFVAWINGKPDFRVVDPKKIVDAYHDKRCWVCGQQLGVYKTLAIGPMCVINRTTSEPPSHKDCAIFAAQACPFLVNPKMIRNDKDTPEGVVCPGIHFDRNPGVVALWTTRGYVRPRKVPNGILFTFDDPDEVLWFAHGRAATRAEVDASIAGGLPLLQKVADDEGNGASEDLAQLVAEAQRYLPVAE